LAAIEISVKKKPERQTMSTSEKYDFAGVRA
jgi:hypothetical protein